MIIIEYGPGLTDIDITLGAADTENPPAPLGFVVRRHGTNNQDEQIFLSGDITPGETFVTLKGLDKAIFEFSGQYDYIVEDRSGAPPYPIIEKGLLTAAIDEIQLPDYGTDKQRGEFKG